MHVHGRVLGMEGPENKDAVLITADWDPVTEGLGTTELLVNLDVYRKLVATAEWEVSLAMDSTILVVLVLSKDGDLVIFTELVVGPTKVLLVDRAMAADIDKRSAANVALSALEVFKKNGAVIVFSGRDIVLEYSRVV